MKRIAAFLTALGIVALDGRRVSAVDPPSHPPAVLKEKPIRDEDRNHWAFLAPKRTAPPAVKERRWLRNPIDAFVLEALETEGLKHAAEANRTTLVRRLSFDLTGLPPSPEEIAEYLDDTRPDAYERVVERLLASPHYGERWAQHWLDLARYADTDGFEFDQVRENAWRYRDWVVDAINRDLPYDRFVRMQLAGDEAEPESLAAFIATGFNRCYPDMVDLNDQGLRRQNALNDMTETTGLAFLGLTIGCARCHDHKFDPIRQSDFYRLQAFFTPARFRDDYPVASPAQRAVYEREIKKWEDGLAEVQAELIAMEMPVRERIAPGLPAGLGDEVIAAIQKDPEQRSSADVRLVYDALAKDRRVSPAALSKAFPPQDRQRRSELLSRLEHLKRSAPPRPPYARGLDEISASPPPTYFLRRGEYTAKGPVVVPAFPVVLCASEPASIARATAAARSTGRRSALAEWLMRTDHPLTARVMVNRLWQHHFGRGIVATPSDFGTMGAEPTHLELLDWLATEFVARGWSLKAMHRLMVTSATYRQAARPDPAALAADPDNVWLARHKPQRLDGEAIRDALLFVSGRINPALGGPPVFPKLPAELTKLSSKGAVWPVSPRVEDRNRRSLYVFVRRNLRFPFFEAFDRPDTNASCPRRAATTIAPQALTLLNGALSAESASALALRVAREAGPDEAAQVRLVYRLALARDPDGDERRIAAEFLARGASIAQFCLAILNTNEFVYLE